MAKKKQKNGKETQKMGMKNKIWHINRKYVK